MTPISAVGLPRSRSTMKRVPAPATTASSSDTCPTLWRSLRTVSPMVVMFRIGNRLPVREMSSSRAMAIMKITVPE